MPERKINMLDKDLADRLLTALELLQTPDPEFLIDARGRWDETNRRLLGIENALTAIADAVARGTQPGED